MREDFVNHRLAHAAHQAFERANDARTALLVQYLFEQDQAARGGVHHRAVGLAFVRGPVFVGDFVFEQCHAGADIGYAQNRFGQAHQRQAFGIGELIFVQHRLHPVRRFDVAHGVYQLGGVIGDLLACHVVPTQLGDAFTHQ